MVPHASRRSLPLLSRRALHQAAALVAQSWQVAAALSALSASAASYEGNLLALSIEAARQRATVGEISQALERQWGRYVPHHSIGSGAYIGDFRSNNNEIEETVQLANSFADKHGRRPRILVAKMGQVQFKAS